MAIFKKKETEALKTSTPGHPQRSLSEIVHERVMTAEGWRRKVVGKTSPPPKKPPVAK